MSYQDPITVSGSLVTFNDPDGDGRITNLSAAISPVQDLNGYDHPWPAGGGVNIWDEQWEVGQYNSSASTVIKDVSNKHIRSKNPIPVSPETTYYMQSAGKNVHLIVADSDGNVLFRTVSLNNGTFTTPANGVFVYFNTAQAYGTTYNNDIAINYPATVTAYSPYSNICPISGLTGLSVYVSPTTSQADATIYAVDWTTQAGTVYGGTLDVVTGVLTVDRASISSYAGETLPGAWISDRDVYAPGALPTTGAQVVYELATPLTYQLTPQEVDALLGTNNIWSDAGDVTVTYQLARHGFEGWLIKVGTEQTEIPINFIRYSTYKVTPDQRMEWSAERNVNGVLQRETVPNMPPKIEFNTKLLTNSDVTALMSILNKSFTVASERKLPVYFYDPENNTYKTWDCYMPDIDFKIRNVDTVKNIINYEELRFAFIGY